MEADLLPRITQCFHDASIPLTVDLEPEMRFDEIDGIDSVSIVRLIMSLEEGFSIEISQREAARLHRIVDLAELIERKRQTGGA